MFRHSKRQVDDLTAPLVDGPVNGAQQRLDVRASARRANNVGGKEANVRRQRQDDVGNRCAVRGTLMAVVWERLSSIGAEDSTLDGMAFLAALPAARCQQVTLNPAVDDANAHP